MNEEYLKNLRILVAEDSDFLRRIHMQFFRDLTDQPVGHAEDGAMAVRYLDRHPVDLLITDIEMPKVNGLELIKRIRLGQTSASTALPIIVISSFANKEIVGSCLQLEINGFLAKPITKQSVNQKVSIAVQEKFVLNNHNNFAEVCTEIKHLTGTAKEKTAAPKGKLMIPEHLEPGMVLNNRLYSKDGKLLLKSGHILSDSLIHRLVDIKDIIDMNTLRVL